MSFGTMAAGYLNIAGETTQPLAAWNFENEVDDTCADVTGGGYILTRGALGAWVLGYNSGIAAQGDPVGTQAEAGAGAYGLFPGGSPGSNPLTVCFWARVPSLATWIACVSGYNASGRGDPWGIWIDSDGSVQADWYSDADVQNGSPASMTPGVISENTWAHIAGVFVPGTGTTVYVNGVAVTTYDWQSGSSAFYGTWETLLVGSSRWGSAGAIVDDLRIYNEVLTDTQITTLMNQPV